MKELEENLSNILNSIVEFYRIIHVECKKGMDRHPYELDYNCLLETLYLTSIPGMTERLIKGAYTPISECKPFDEENC